MKLCCHLFSGLFITSLMLPAAIFYYAASLPGRLTGAFTWPSLYDICHKCQLNLSLREQALLPALDVFGVGWVINPVFQSEDDPRSNILKLNTEGLTAKKIYVIEQLAYRNKAFSIVLRQSHCTTSDKLVIPNFSLDGSVLSRNHGLATFVHEPLEWSLVDQSLELSETDWSCVDVARYEIINVYKPPRSRFTPTGIPTFPHPSLYVANMSTGVTTKHS